MSEPCGKCGADISHQGEYHTNCDEVANAFAAGAAAQRVADLRLFQQWAKDVELPFGGTLQSRHTFNVGYEEFVRGEPLVKHDPKCLNHDPRDRFSGRGGDSF